MRRVTLRLRQSFGSSHDAGGVRSSRSRSGCFVRSRRCWDVRAELGWGVSSCGIRLMIWGLVCIWLVERGHEGIR